MKTAFRFVIGVAIVEVILAIYNVPVANLPLMLAVTFVALAFLVLAKITLALIADRRHERETFLAATQSQFNQKIVSYPRDTISPQFDPTFQLMQTGFQMLAESQQQTNSLLNHLVQNQMRQRPGLIRYQQPEIIEGDWIEEGE